MLLTINHHSEACASFHRANSLGWDRELLNFWKSQWNLRSFLIQCFCPIHWKKISDSTIIMVLVSEALRHLRYIENDFRQCNHCRIRASFARAIPYAVRGIMQSNQNIRFAGPHCRQHLCTYTNYIYVTFWNKYLTWILPRSIEFANK